MKLRRFRLAGGAGITALGVFALALVPRLIYLAQLGGAPGGRLLYLDAQYYAEQAARILGGDWILGLRPFEMAPLYPFLLAGAVSLVGWDFQALRLIQMVLGAAGCAATGLAGRRLFGPGAGFAAGLLAAGAGPLIFEEGNLLKEGPATGLLGLFLWGLAAVETTETAGDSSDRRAAGAGSLKLLLLGALLGAIVLLREQLLIAGAVLTLAIAWRRRRGGWSRAWQGAGAFGLGLLLPILPVTARNLAVGGEWVLLTTSGGESFYMGNGPQANGFYSPPPFVRLDPKLEHEDFLIEASRREGRRLRPAESSRYWFREALSSLAADPGRAVRLYLRKLRILLASGYPEDNYSFSLYRRWCPILSFLPGFGVLIPLALAGLAIGWRRADRLVLIFGAAIGAALLPFFVFGRFRLPLIPWLALFGGLVVARAAAALRERRRRELAAVVLITLLMLGAQRTIGLEPKPAPFFENIFLLHVAEQRQDFQGMERIGRGLLAELEAHPRSFGSRRAELRAEALLAIGRARIQTGRAGSGLEALRRSYRARPRADVAAAIVGLESKLVSPAAAERSAAAAVADFPADSYLRLQWAELLSARGAPQRARAQLEAAARIAPGDPAVQFEVARRLGSGPAARAALDRFLALKPEERDSPAVTALREQQR
ncbi:MAG TPA: hypothetical protein VGB99_17605 [Acidobacteriota bacterium]